MEVSNKHISVNEAVEIIETNIKNKGHCFCSLTENTTKFSFIPVISLDKQNNTVSCKIGKNKISCNKLTSVIKDNLIYSIIH